MQEQAGRDVAKHDNAHAVLIAGGGPTGLMLAGELALAGADVAIVERRETQELAGSRAGGLLARTLEVLDQRGIVERFTAEGQVYKAAPFAHTTLNTGDLPSRHSYYLGLWQNRIERLLADWVGELGVPIYRGRDVTGFVQDGGGVDVTLSDGRVLRAQYLVGCDGGRSFVRKHAGIDFPGWEASSSYLIAEAETVDEPPRVILRGKHGVSAIGKIDDTKRVRTVLSEPEVRQGDAPSLDDVRVALKAAFGTDYGICNPTWISRFTDMSRQAAAYRAGRILVAGDAAHVHSPVGGQGLNIGVQDAVNLGWKLAQVVKGVSPDSVLDSYHAERHPVGARVLQRTMALTALERGDERNEALREMLVETMQLDEARRRYYARMLGLDVHYDLGAGHPLLGRRMPDLDLRIGGRPQRLFSLLHAARPVCLTLRETGALDITPWSDYVQTVDARYDGVMELPVFGVVEVPPAVLIRPDGHVAWVGDGTARGLREALTLWCGPSER